MYSSPVIVEQLPTTFAVTTALKNIFSEDEIDLRDVTSIALQDPVVLANIVLLVNKQISGRGRPVVNTVQAAINLVGLPKLKDRLLQIENIENRDITSRQLWTYDLVRNRIYVAANMTSFWAKYMGEKSIEEQYCASMFTGLNILSNVVNEDNPLEQTINLNYNESIDTLRELYSFCEKDIQSLPDSIQQVLTQSLCVNRLNLSVLTFELITALEFGYACEEFSRQLQLVIEVIDQSASRACYDLARQIVCLQKSSSYTSFDHSGFLVSTNNHAVAPLAFLQ